MNFETAASPLHNETDQQYRIFMQFALQQETNISQLARDFDIPISTLHRWKSDFDWDARARVIDAEVRFSVLEKGAETFKRDVAKLHAIGENLLSKLHKETQAAEIDTEKVDAIDKAAKAADRIYAFYARTSWVDRVIQTLKETQKHEIAQKATESDVKALLPKASDRTTNPDDEKN